MHKISHVQRIAWLQSFAHELQWFGWFCTSQIVTKIGRKVFPYLMQSVIQHNNSTLSCTCLANGISWSSFHDNIWKKGNMPILCMNSPTFACKSLQTLLVPTDHIAHKRNFDPVTYFSWLPSRLPSICRKKDLFQRGKFRLELSSCLAY